MPKLAGHVGHREALIQQQRTRSCGASHMAGRRRARSRCTRRRTHACAGCRTSSCSTAHRRDQGTPTPRLGLTRAQMPPPADPLAVARADAPCDAPASSSHRSRPATRRAQSTPSARAHVTNIAPMPAAVADRIRQHRQQRRISRRTHSAQRLHRHRCQGTNLPARRLRHLAHKASGIARNTTALRRPLEDRAQQHHRVKQRHPASTTHNAIGPPTRDYLRRQVDQPQIPQIRRDVHVVR
ncbi:MAG: hypothetical protein QOD83_282 [Solirubrobacteraceae bacterium]|nr:hypothetical protein [Solirubrobacteraceae bacterium]